VEQKYTEIAVNREAWRVICPSPLQRGTDRTGRTHGARRGDACRRRLLQSAFGLDLSIARKAVRAHGGDILIRNMPGKGCVFVIDVPLASEEEPAPPAVA
jgi:hypothetical protein